MNRPTDDASSTLAAGQEGRVDDAHRPRYHYLPPANWMNDPNGLIHWKGEYHLFYQYNPNGAFWGTMHWGHAASADLVHWTDLPIALAPTPGSYDEDGCFSGCAVDNAGVPTIIYTGVRGEDQLPCVATGSDDLRTLHKDPGNPVITGPPPGLHTTGFRDHTAWKEGDTWYQLVGSGIRDVGGTALLYRSPDLLHWEYVHPIYIGDLHQTDPVWTGSMWECPDFFPLGDRHVLVVSVWDYDRTLYPLYFTGAYAGHKFTPERLHRLDFGASFYAPQSLRDAQGRRIMWGWLREEREPQAHVAAGWAGVMSLPRVLSLRPDGMLDMRPAPELASLRGPRYHLRDVDLKPEGSPLPTDLRGDTLEIIAELDPGDATEIGIAVRCAPDHSEQTRVTYDPFHQRLAIDSSESSLSAEAQGGAHSGPLPLSGGEMLRLQVFIDRSVVEVFGNERVCVTSRVYPSQADTLGVELFAQGGAARLISMDAWEISPI
jgi:beta-fructofuranosidase